MNKNTNTKIVFGTKEWADENVNIQNGCPNDCRYCYAKAMAVQYKRETRDIQRRRAALLSLDWDIRIVSQAQDNPIAQEQADFLRLVYDNIDNFREAISFLFSAFFRGFAHLEKHWAASGELQVDRAIFSVGSFLIRMPAAFQNELPGIRIES